MAETRRIVIIAPYLPVESPDNAGLGYLQSVRAALSESSVVFIAPDTARNRNAAQLAGAPDHVLVTVDPPNSALLRSLRSTAERLTPVRPVAGFLNGIRHSPRSRMLLDAADVVDLQWPSMSAMLPHLRPLAPSATFIATLHDVASQRFARQLARARTLPRIGRLASSLIHARLVERRVARTADTIIVFGEKDRALLPRRARSTVIHPPLARSAPDTVTSFAPLDAPSAPPTAVFVGPLRRPENLDGLEWFTREVWPRVRRSVPDAQLRVAGSLTSVDTSMLADTPGIELLGFIDDLDEVYRTATLVIAPLRLGAGVKFKVLDAMARGIPVVATRIGAEGIGDSELTLETHDDAVGFAAAVMEAMGDSPAPRRAATRAREWMDARYSRVQFERAVAGVYGTGMQGSSAWTETSASDRIEPPAISVVIPVRNGELGIGNALAALARQGEARDLEVIISDNGSTDGTAEVARAFRSAFADLRVVDSGDRAGVSHARNVGIRAATADKILICDHDDEARPGWVTALAAGLDDFDVVGGRAVSVQISGTKSALQPHEDAADAVRDVFGYLPYVLGGCMGVRRGAALAVGGFDETFLRGHEEADFCWRLQQAGYSLGGAPGALLDYRQRDRARDAGRQRYHSARTRILLWTRHAHTGRLGAISFKGSVRHAIFSVRYVPLLLLPSKRFSAARRIGWALGTLDGHLRYRILGTPPPAATMVSR